ncbi:MAG TPA: SDR family oxidoreductase [Myxococcota bacterium]|nr:SDR family oxidoreductase [Myxococcota bacterium]
MKALVTGAARRVGRAIAVELARSGFEVAVHHRGTTQDVLETLRLCEEAGGSAWAIQADLETVEGCRALVDAVRDRWDELHVLVHNASSFEPRPFEGITLEAWDRMMAIHARAPFLVTQGLLDRLRAARSCAAGAEPGEGGLVVCMLDIGAERPLPGYTPYSVSKAGLLMLMRSLAVELAPAVRCIGVSPGQVAWPEGYGEPLREAIRKRIPMRRVGAPEDVARLVRFVALESPYLNGVVVDVDGGLAVRYG